MPDPGSNDRTTPVSQVPTAPVPAGARPRPRPAFAHLAPGAVISRYRIESVLGEGGMGTVYLARQEKPDRQVALKVIRPGYATERMLRRFELEAEVLGRLLHPGIAQIYEAGVVHADDEASSRRALPIPFFAMELVKGVPLTQYAREKNLSTRERLELLAKVCDAVQHAHQKGVIHRDLKPSNILVVDEVAEWPRGEVAQWEGGNSGPPRSGRHSATLPRRHSATSPVGQPKILDFGVARATDSDLQQTTAETGVGAIIGTVPYMSPEQVGGDPAELDTRSDVYALGVIAYELLVGRLPYDLERKMIHEAARIIREEEPTRLSSIDRTLRGDVETIVGHALEKDKARRYGAASALAADIRRFLSDEPITARPASTWYQFAKFSRRNKGFVGGVAAAFVVLLVGLVLTLALRADAVRARNDESAARWRESQQRVVAERRRDAAQAAQKESDLIAEFMSDVLRGVGPRVARGRDTTMLAEMMDAASARIENGELRNAPAAELRLRDSIGNVYRELSLLDRAARTFEGARVLALARFPGDSLHSVVALNNLGLAKQFLGDRSGAEACLRAADEMGRRCLPDSDQMRAKTASNLSLLLKEVGSLDEAESLAREALDLTRTNRDADPTDVAAMLNNLSDIRQARGDAAGAEALCLESLTLLQSSLPADHPYLALSLNNLATYAHERGDFVRAESLVRRAIAIQDRVLRPSDPMRLPGAVNLAAALRARGDDASAERSLREVVEQVRPTCPVEHPYLLLALEELADACSRVGKHDEAARLCTDVLAIVRRSEPMDRARVVKLLISLAFQFERLDRPQDAEPMYAEALEIRRSFHGGADRLVAESLHSLASLRADLGRPAEAIPLFLEALDMRRQLLAGDHPDIATTLYRLALAQQDTGDAGSAEPNLREALSIERRTLGDDHPSTLVSQYALVSFLIDWGRPSEGAPLVEECVSGNAKRFGDTHAETRDAVELAVRLYESWNKLEPGSDLDAKSAAWKARLDAIDSSMAPQPAPPGGPPT